MFFPYRHVLVIGSDSPWIETILLAKGAAKITTLEYANITVEHPKITVIGPQKLKELYNNVKSEFKNNYLVTDRVLPRLNILLFPYRIHPKDHCHWPSSKLFWDHQSQIKTNQPKILKLTKKKRKKLKKR